MNDVNKLTNEDDNDLAITFHVHDGEIEVLKITKNGDFYVRGNKVTNDIEVYEAMKEWLKDAGFLK